MQASQLTNDAGYKFELWRKLLGESLALTAAAPSPAEDAVLAAITRVSLPTVQGRLPRRVREPCCLAGSCATPGIPYVHHSIRLGRSRVETVESCRDELCFCLAHAMACAGPAVDLVVRGYYSSANDMRSRYRGLRCLLHHTHPRSITFEGIDNQHDTRELVGELCHLLQHRRAGSCWTQLHLRQCPLGLTAFRSLLTHLQRCDALTHVSLEGCYVGSSAVVADYVQSTRVLTHLSLRGTPMASGWDAIARAVAHAPSVAAVCVAACNWQDRPHLASFVTALAGLAPRPRLALDLSANLLTSACFAVLAAADASVRAGVTELHLGGHRLSGDEEAVSSFFSAYERLDAISLRQSTLSTGAAQRVLRALGDKKKLWRLVDVSYTTVPSASFKRLCQTAFGGGGEVALCCTGVDVHGQLTKVVFASCAAVLTRLELARCSLTDDCVGQLASALEKAAPLPLRHLSLAHNIVDKAGTKGDGSFLFLCKALRLHSAPLLTSLDLSGNKLPLLPIVAFVEQASTTVRAVNFSHTSIADSPVDRMRVLTTLVRRQRGALPFTLLDVVMVSSVGDAWTGMKEINEWLTTQTSVRLETESEKSSLWNTLR